MAVLMIVLDTMDVYPVENWVSWPTAIVALLWVYAVPKLLMRTMSRCPECSENLKAELHDN